MLTMLRIASLSLTSIIASQLLLTSPVRAETADAIHAEIENTLGMADDFDTIFKALRKTMASNDNNQIAELADLIEFPIDVTGGNGTVTVKDAGQFYDNIDELVPKNVRDAVAKQRYQDLLVRSDGVMFGNGQLWMSVLCSDQACNNSYWAITAINRSTP